jgi:hypothetical protein
MSDKQQGTTGLTPEQIAIEIKEIIKTKGGAGALALKDLLSITIAEAQGIIAALASPPPAIAYKAEYRQKEVFFSEQSDAEKWAKDEKLGASFEWNHYITPIRIQGKY